MLFQIGFSLFILVLGFGLLSLLSRIMSSTYKQNDNSTYRTLRLFLNKYSGYLISFTVGVILTTFFQLLANPYYTLRWLDMYDKARFGDLVVNDEITMETGRINENVLAWYKER